MRKRCSSTASAEELAFMIRRFRTDSSKKLIEAAEAISHNSVIPSEDKRRRLNLLSELKDTTWLRFVYTVRDQYSAQVVSDALAIVRAHDAVEDTSETKH